MPFIMTTAVATDEVMVVCVSGSRRECLMHVSARKIANADGKCEECAITRVLLSCIVKIPGRRIAEPDGRRWECSGKIAFRGPPTKQLCLPERPWRTNKEKPVPAFNFIISALRREMMPRNRKTNFVVARLCWPIRCVDVPRTITTNGPTKCRNHKIGHGHFRNELTE